MATGTTFGVVQTDGLVGREQDFEVVRSFARHASVSGGGLVIEGDPGVGKTSLLDVVTIEAWAALTKIVWAAGVTSEAEIRYAGPTSLSSRWQGRA